jgi:hypothetical protein
MADAEHSYLVHLKPEGGRRRIEGASFEDAALAYLEACHPPADAEGEVSLIVREETSGAEQCFRIDMETGRTEPCD